MSTEEIQLFQETIWDYFAKHRRIFPWRYVDDPYAVLVSEVMLQQTQTDRVVPKYEQFMAHIPSFAVLAEISVRDLLYYWQGLGYNRRALYLQKTAQIIMTQHGGELPADPTVLQTFPGIGVATAASITVFAFNKPVAFIETNVRAVFIHYFFTHQMVVSDKEIMPLVEQTLDPRQPRDWFYALMDFGVMLKKQQKNPSRKSAHYTKQSKFEGSDRQLRGAIVRYLVQHKTTSIAALELSYPVDVMRLQSIVDQLCKEGLVSRTLDGQLTM